MKMSSLKLKELRMTAENRNMDRNETCPKTS